MNKKRIFIQLSIKEKFVEALINSKVTRNIMFQDYARKSNVFLIRKTKTYLLRTIN